MIHDNRSLELGEGALWHPERQELFWFDILGQSLHGAGQDWMFDDPASAAGWVDRHRLVVATAKGLSVLNLATDERRILCPLEADRPDTRSNDGKADPWGGFWIGTMGRQAQVNAGALYRWYQDEVRTLRKGMTIPNSTCFDAARGCAYFSDTAEGIVFRQGLDPRTGWPVGGAEVFLDLSALGLNPDGATVDAEGRVWIAQWGAGRVACYAPDGALLGAETFPASQTSCPVFGGPALDTLFVTSAMEGMDAAGRRAEPHGGKTFVCTPMLNGTPVIGVAEPRVRLDW
ncbi:SMP-30/gluconolactonase/LRE family protein [Falsirhodobacter halotolerans]|uniref:SMP-30/gluconolactonase/LRE family protein n=1 Tax=Falsirhodobacter halotolerans TaxID=1146892 RepID=UPI001FD17D84|nr:SMP-30/gluconolactonase/LRE family protein [Falsirhodobacter halotolerans]MCJ8141104.1 SMP-30/gluconolactonase/LRE family protein [Falsirhodobacter halotolerans]